jgi:hypothetical protein
MARSLMNMEELVEQKLAGKTEGFRENLPSATLHITYMPSCCLIEDQPYL